jgi:hypothetical protein
VNSTCVEINIEGFTLNVNVARALLLTVMFEDLISEFKSHASETEAKQQDPNEWNVEADRHAQNRKSVATMR